MTDVINLNGIRMFMRNVNVKTHLHVLFNLLLLVSQLTKCINDQTFQTMTTDQSQTQLSLCQTFES